MANTDLTNGKIEQLLQSRLQQLHSKGQKDQLCSNIDQSSGMISIGVGGIICALGFPTIGVVPLVVGAIAYGVSTLVEGKVTGEIRPFPFIETGLGDLMIGLDNASFTPTSTKIDLTGYSYLSGREKSEFVLLSMIGKDVAAFLETIPDPFDRASAWEKILNQFHGLYAQYVKASPYALNQVGKAELREYFLTDTDTETDPLSLPIGQNTRLGALDTDGEFVAESIPTGSEKPAAMPNKAQLLAMPLKDRAIALLDQLVADGCNLKSLINRPTLACGGLQRSGKTTLMVLLAIFEKALGQNITYVTRDADIYPVAFDAIASGSTTVAVNAFAELGRLINSASMGSLTGRTFVLDEFLAIVSDLEKEKADALWRMVLSGFAKQGARVRVITHAKTATANRIPGGMSELYKSEFKFLWTDRLEDEYGNYSPSGEYQVWVADGQQYKPTGEYFIIPDWLLTDSNPNWGNAPCPVRSLLTYFPEFDTRKGAKVGEFIGASVERVDVGESEGDRAKADQELQSPEEILELKVRKKLVERLKTRRGEWLNLREFINNSFGDNESRKVAKVLMTELIKRGIISSEVHENRNKSESIYISYQPTTVNTNSDDKP